MKNLTGIEYIVLKHNKSFTETAQKDALHVNSYRYEAKKIKIYKLSVI